jgi:hypothetical protein
LLCDEWPNFKKLFAWSGVQADDVLLLSQLLLSLPGLHCVTTYLPIITSLSARKTKQNKTKP